MARTPEDKALSDVEKAIKDEEKAQEKFESLKEKYEAANTAYLRSHKTTVWTASHPDLPDDFNLEQFRKQLAEPFEEPEAIAPEVTVAPRDDLEVSDDDVEVLSSEDEAAIVEAVREAEAETDEDDPFGDGDSD